ncbi:hypothetical protein GZ77_03775 [Endozoicomonas montiporae]|uniref:Uncharacterized protein n=2 Tax=Endozoicomonas montiporae TaxID=1027273 RepID=A0A081NB77_9GAMM|nr:hypothetical protein [Endozoicomonas montiporae]AMO56581.1 hypothetical protein EZMO1_2499 [Endozoicomonas montiporae CL-33]KEQ15700.1 hypothetical protein GZ77_03775 [Endozoicomonas montiporae]
MMNAREEARQENHKRDCLARHLISQPFSQQRDFLKTMKVPALKQDITRRMREQLALQIADMPQNLRQMRFTQLKELAKRSQRNYEWYVDIRNRVNDILKTRNASHV